ncbi:MAG: glucose-6-phosphate isomerase [Candidatus Omnitrophica bacterium]|nr:glucose-6-phosphate isomerase [Candidatus Omnitrophota bacterium]
MEQDLRLDTGYLEGFVSENDLGSIFPEVKKAHALLTDRTGPGNDFLGWMDLPESTTADMLGDIEECADRMKRNSDIVIIIGIGGSYLGAKAAIEMMAPRLGEKKVLFAGHNLCGGYLEEFLKMVKSRDRDISVNVISKSGTTTEPAIAFRVVEDFMRKRYGAAGLKDRIVCTTDKKRGALRSMADAMGYRSFVIPEDVGGRFSVLTAAGLLPVACADINIRGIIAGARRARERSASCDPDGNISYKYAAVRNILYRKGKNIEIFSNFDHGFHYVAEWWKQLFGESEGKGEKGIFPASCDFTTDLHSMGQWIQAGSRNIFETFLIEDREDSDCPIPGKEEDPDGLNYLSGKQVSFVNKQAYQATAAAHFEGGVPNSTIFLPERSAFCLGQLFYFLEKAVAVSAYVLGVNPFDQPGVDSYKKKMFEFLGKPGH